MADLHIAVFAKAPVSGQVKTRLIPLLGPAGAAAAHRRMLQHALHIAVDTAAGNVSLWISGAPDDPFLRECCTRFDLPAHRQIEGDLGERMADCLHRLRLQHHRVLLIGSDCPALSMADLQMADAALQRGARMVFTPAEDGGYVLVGCCRSPDNKTDDAYPHAFIDIAWSTDQVMAQTRDRLAAQGWRAEVEWAEMPMRWDVDEPADYLRAVGAGLLPPMESKK